MHLFSLSHFFWLRAFGTHPTSTKIVHLQLPVFSVHSICLLFIYDYVVFAVVNMDPLLHFAMRIANIIYFQHIRFGKHSVQRHIIVYYNSHQLIAIYRRKEINALEYFQMLLHNQDSEDLRRFCFMWWMLRQKNVKKKKQ